MPSAFRPKVEICVEGVDEAVLAAKAGADRVELCAAMTEGGLTPSVGVVRQALARLGKTGIMAMVRPRGGDFLYSEAEFAAMLDDVATMRDLGVTGVVAGCLEADGTIAAARMAALVAAAGPLEVTCHRAFDMTRDPDEALEALIAAGVGRVLTSGMRPDARQGLALLQRLAVVAEGRITLLVCGALTPRDIDPAGRGLTGYEFHFAKVAMAPGPMAYVNPDVFMGADDGRSEYARRVVDVDALARAILGSKGG